MQAINQRPTTYDHGTEEVTEITLQHRSSTKLKVSITPKLAKVKLN